MKEATLTNEEVKESARAQSDTTCRLTQRQRPLSLHRVNRCFIFINELKATVELIA